MGVLGAIFGGTMFATSGPKKSAAAATQPPINAGSSDEADFIKCANSISARLRAAGDGVTLTARAGSSSRRTTAARRTKGGREEGEKKNCGWPGWACTRLCTYRSFWDLTVSPKRASFENSNQSSLMHIIVSLLSLRLRVPGWDVA